MQNEGVKSGGDSCDGTSSKGGNGKAMGALEDKEKTTENPNRRSPVRARSSLFQRSTRRAKGFNVLLNAKATSEQDGDSGLDGKALTRGSGDERKSPVEHTVGKIVGSQSKKYGDHSHHNDRVECGIGGGAATQSSKDGIAGGLLFPEGSNNATYRDVVPKREFEAGAVELDRTGEKMLLSDRSRGRKRRISEIGSRMGNVNDACEVQTAPSLPEATGSSLGKRARRNSTWNTLREEAVKTTVSGADGDVTGDNALSSEGKRVEKRRSSESRSPVGDAKDICRVQYDPCSRGLADSSPRKRVKRNATRATLCEGGRKPSARGASAAGGDQSRDSALFAYGKGGAKVSLRRESETKNRRSETQRTTGSDLAPTNARVPDMRTRNLISRTDPRTASRKNPSSTRPQSRNRESPKNPSGESSKNPSGESPNGGRRELADLTEVLTVPATTQALGSRSIPRSSNITEVKDRTPASRGKKSGSEILSRAAPSSRRRTSRTRDVQDCHASEDYEQVDVSNEEDSVSSLDQSETGSSDDSSQEETSSDYCHEESLGNAATSKGQAPNSLKEGRFQKRSYRFINRKKGENVDSDLARKRSDVSTKTSEEDFAKWTCCARRRCFQHADLVYLRSQREIILKSSQSERKRSLGEMLGRDGNFYFNGKRVCTTFLVKAFRFSRDLQSSVKGTPAAPAPTNPYRGPKNNVQCIQREFIISFLKDLATAAADEMPNSSEKHLPYHQKLEVYSLLRTIHRNRQQETSDLQPPTFAYFVRIWKEYVSYIKVRKIRPFSKCYICEEARQALADAAGDRAKCAPILSRRAEHLKMVTMERAGYLSRATRAIQEPENVWSIAIDGADQSRFGLPHFKISTTKQTRGHALKVKVIGLLQHGNESNLFLYTMTGQFETGANHVIEVMHRWMIRKMKCGHFPDVLYVQADNTTRENKNRFLLGYLECLVAWGVFQEIQLSFLPVGHTHIDIDQRFSCTSRKLKVSDAISMDDLHVKLREAVTPRPFLSRLDHIGNISGLLQQSGALRDPPPFSENRFFRLMRASGRPTEGTGRFRTTCRVKMSCDEDWGRLFETEPDWGFIKKAPDLNETPNTIRRAPNDREEVEARIESEYARINDEKKRITLLKLLQKVYSDGEDNFHWDTASSPEMNGRHEFGKRREPVNMEIDLDTYEPRTRIHYENNSFVAVFPDDSTDDCPFWIAQVTGNKRNSAGVVAGVHIIWYELEEGYNDVYKGKYKVSEKKDGKGKSQVWTATICTDAVFFNFPKLTVKRTLSRDDARMIAEQCSQASHARRPERPVRRGSRRRNVRT